MWGRKKVNADEAYGKHKESEGHKKFLMLAEVIPPHKENTLGRISNKIIHNQYNFPSVSKKLYRG